MDTTLNVSNMFVPNMDINIGNVDADTEINQQSKPISPEATHADNNVIDDRANGSISVYA